ncbi:MAG TPA: hypothetical protein VGA88_08435 [Burkholderiales bacterium]|jgi:hypothetical protein
MSVKSKPRDKRWGERRQKADRRQDVRWEPNKSARRASGGRRQSDRWDISKKR